VILVQEGGIKLDNAGLVRLLAASLVQDDIDEPCRLRTLPPHLTGAECHEGGIKHH
jgi:hypothetical protein